MTWLETAAKRPVDPLLVAKGLRGQARSRGASADSWMLKGLAPGWGEGWLPDSRGRLEPPAPGAVTWPQGSSLPHPRLVLLDGS